MLFARNIILVALVLSAGICGCTRKTSPEPIFIGHLAPLRGALKYQGEQAKQGIVLALEEVNKNPPPPNLRKVNVIHPETSGEKDEEQAAAVRLLNVDKVVALIGKGLGDEDSGIVRVAENYEVPCLLTKGSPRTTGDNYAFYLGTSSSFRGKMLARFALKELKAEHIVALRSEKTTQNDFLEAFSREIRAERRSLQGDHVYKEAKEIADLLKSIVKKPSTFILFLGNDEDFKELQKVPLPEKTTLLINDAEKMAIQPGVSMPVYYPVDFVIDGGTPQAQEFAKKYQSHFGEPPTGDAALAYEGLRMLVEVVKESKTLEGKDLRAGLASLKDFPGLTGPLVFSKANEVQRPLYILRQEGEEIKTVKRYEAEQK